ncbi:MAG: hypothetical protein HOO06_07530 [Bdellovibrionaceae bacterium]|jgi:hypothetical protein|nr:hypothetical protein [Pseudobdellovibrionaceae bacterium]
MKKLLALLFVGMFSLNAHALFLEPYVGYERGVYGLTDHSGTLVGGRIGTEIAVLFFVGADVMMLASGTADTIGASGDMSRSTMGLVFGVDLPLVKAWVGYNFQDNFSFTYGNTTTDYESTSQKVGVGFTVFPMISANLEYINSEISKAGTTTVGLDSNLGTYLLSLSFTL